VTNRTRYVWLIVGVALLCFSLYWRIFGLPALDDPIEEIRTTAPILFPLGLMAVFAWIVWSSWRDYRKSADEFDLANVVKFGFGFVMLIVVIVLTLYGI